MKLVKFLLPFAFAATSCGVVNETSKYQLETGTYKVKNYKHNPYYVLVEEDSIVVHPLTQKGNEVMVDTTNAVSVFYNKLKPGAVHTPVTFVMKSFDLDVLTIPVKYRPYTNGFPNQLNTNFNGALYFGHRSDLYHLNYDKSPINTWGKTLTRFAYSFGLFAGIGASALNPFVTNSVVDVEYDGVILSKGVAGIFGIGNLNFGGAIGLDHLMDKNRKVWIYQGKLWAGLTVGLNIN